MSSEIVQQGAQIVCDHQAPAQPQVVSTRVKLGGAGAVTAPAQYTVSGCPFTTESPKPCAMINFTVGALRVKVEGKPVLLKSAVGLAMGPLPVQGQGTVRMTQTRVKAT